MKFEIVVKQGLHTVHRIPGFVTLEQSQLTLEDLGKIPEVENYLERLTGFRFHIDQV